VRQYLPIANFLSFNEVIVAHYYYNIYLHDIMKDTLEKEKERERERKCVLCARAFFLSRYLILLYLSLDKKIFI